VNNPEKGEVSMYPKQRGITMIGWLFLLIPIAIVGYSALRLAPLYLNYMKVARTLERTAKEHASDESNTPQGIRNTIDKHFDIESVTFPTVKDIGVRRDGQTWVIEANYEDVVPLFAQISLLVKFNKMVEVK
jgi:hypothetical protein